MIVQHNLRAMNSNRMLGLTQATQSKSTEKLSSGYKINRAADDAAGLVLSGLAIGLYGGGHFAEILMKTIRESEDWKNREMRRRLKKAFFTAALPHAAGVSLFQVKRLSIQLLQWHIQGSQTPISQN